MSAVTAPVAGPALAIGCVLPPMAAAAPRQAALARAGMPIVVAGPLVEGHEMEFGGVVDGDRVRHVGPVGRARRNELLAGAAALVFPRRTLSRSASS